MSDFQVVYIPVGVPTFDLECAQKEFDKSVQMLSEISQNVIVPAEMLLTIDKLETFLEGLCPDLIILQNITFANAAYAGQVLKRYGCPVLLWTLREPASDGGRLRLNSLTGAYSAGNALHAFGREKFTYVYGGPGEAAVVKTVSAAIRAGQVRHSMKTLKLAAVGHTPQGFGFGRALDGEMLHTFGVTLESIEARELIERAKSYSDEECAAYLAQADNVMTGLQDTPDKNLKDFARLYKAYAEYTKENGVGALASRCWPDFFTAYGTPVCAVLAMLNDSGVAAACESDAYGALSMYIGSQLTGGAPTFFGDPVALDEQESTITFWHCGTAACSLACKQSGAAVGVHPNRRLGPAMDFGCKPCKEVTVFRIGRKPDGSFRLFILEGEALDKPKQYCGTSLVVQTNEPAKDVVCRSVEDGWEPHFVVIYGAVKTELKILGSMLGLEVCAY